MAPKVFVSYSWSSPEHEERVLTLATELRELGTDVVLDKWDLKEGHDANAFMEKMVTDPEITKVILVCDRAYAEKANSRAGGVGTEAQIISPEIYAKREQDKFVAVIFERDDEGNAYVPAYYGGRIYIDLTDDSASAENFDQLLRWVYDKPLYVRPEIGSPPSFVTEADEVVTLSTSARHRRAIDAVRTEKGNAIALVREYFETLLEEMEKLRLEPSADPFDEAVANSIDGFLPYRNEAIDLLLALSLHAHTPEIAIVVHRFFESAIPYMFPPEGTSGYREWDWDNFRFIIHELFLYAVAALLKYERFDETKQLLETPFYMPRNADWGRSVTVDFDEIRQYMPSLDARNERLKLSRLSLRADMLKTRCTGMGLDFRQLTQADFVLFMRASIAHEDHWWPETLVYLGHRQAPFEIFARSRSLAYFNRSMPLLGAQDKADLEKVLAWFKEDRRRIPRWEFESFDPGTLLGFDALATSP